MAVGDTLPLIELYRGRSGPRGRVSFAAPGREIAARVTNKSGWAAISIMRVGANAQATVLASEARLTPGARVDLPVQALADSSGNVAEVVGPPTDRETCTETKIADYPNRLGVVGELWPGPNAKAQFAYTGGSTSTLGVATSTSGAFGTFSLGGTKSQSSSAAVSYPVVNAGSSKIWQTNWNYANFKTTCNGVSFSTGAYSYSWNEVRSVGWAGGNPGYTPAAPPAATFCHDYLAGGGLTRNSSKATTLSNGVNLSVIGINVSSQTGFSTSASTTYTMVRNGKLCGTNGPATTSGQIVGK